MFYCTTTGQYIQENTPFTIDGVQYPPNWLNLATPEEKSNLGLEEVVATNERKDDKYYWVSETLNGPELTYINTPKQLHTDANGTIGLVTTCSEQINTTAYSLMLPTDWMIIRKTERGVDVPEEVANNRLAIIAECGRLLQEISSVTTVDDLVVVMNSQNWPTNKV